MRLIAIILTKNEERHIERCLASLAGVAHRCLVVDSGSTDRTVELARRAGAQVMHHPWVNYASQFNWAIEQVDPQADWILRLDADEVLSPQLSYEIKNRLHTFPKGVTGAYVSRRIVFLGRLLRFGGLFPVRVLRLFRKGCGHCENRWMDEHIVAQGVMEEFDGEIIDDNRKSLSWWTEKHNGYASREVVDLLNLKFHFMPHETVADLAGRQEAGVKRWLKENLYARLPGGARAFAYFAYRYLLRGGFRDGREGAAFHVLQGLWYRYLVDAKAREVVSHMEREDVDALTAIREVLKIDPLEADRANFGPVQEIGSRLAG